MGFLCKRGTAPLVAPASVLCCRNSCLTQCHRSCCYRSDDMRRHLTKSFHLVSVTLLSSSLLLANEVLNYPYGGSRNLYIWSNAALLSVAAVKSRRAGKYSWILQQHWHHFYPEKSLGNRPRYWYPLTTWMPLHCVRGLDICDTTTITTVHPDAQSLNLHY